MSEIPAPLTYHVERQPRAPKPRKRSAPVFVELTTECQQELNRLDAFLFHRIKQLASPELLELIHAHGDVLSLFDYNTDRTLTLGQWKQVTQHARALIGEVQHD